ncbi:hypothetical protein NHQ30_009712 [Ciborinia camelliae]|nr:hypothetical protein NHQ30_009712 [Ciborinia camelliae]
MRFLPSFVAAGLALFTSVAIAAPYSPIPAPHSGKLQPWKRSNCTNSAADRSCWGGGFDISTNYYDKVPDTGNTVEIWLELVNTTAALDGVERVVLTVNGTFPGPTIIANWGDTVIVHLYNGLQNNGTGLHFHGIRQNYTNMMDGVPSVTQCPTAPGESITYTWRAVQYGSTWYHSHYSLQAWEGVLGGIIINGPATANYDVDAGIMMLNDWTHATSSQTYLSAETDGPPTLDNGLINGTNVYGDLGARFNMTVEAGKSYRIRLVNGAIDSHFKFMIDNHNLTVIAMDLVPIVPYSTQVLAMGMGQRYDIIVTASESSGNFWIRAIPQNFCSNNVNADNIKGIFKYLSSNATEPSTAEPSTTAYSYDDNCDDEDLSNLVPYFSLDASADAVADDFEVSVGFNSAGLFKWYMEATTFVSHWDYPTLEAIVDDNTTWTTSEHVIQVDTANEWVYFIIETAMGVPHPIHLHGHDFYILGQGTGTYSNSTTLSLKNPPRRDVAMLPASGYLVIAFYTDNPGVWLMHCHIGWHTSEGFALQIVERMSEIPALVDNSTLTSNCDAWDSYFTADDLVQDDSGV